EAPRGSGVVHVDDRHQPSRNWNVRASQALWISSSVPPLVVRVDDVLRHLQRRIVAHAGLLLRLENHLAAENGMLLHHSTLVFGERAGLVEHAIRDAD